MSTGLKKTLLILGIVLGAILSLGSIWAIYAFVHLIGHEVGRIDVMEPQRNPHLEIARTLKIVLPGILATPLGVGLLVLCTIGLQRLRKPRGS